jgi:uncharacterized caspase-like protein
MTENTSLTDAVKEAAGVSLTEAVKGVAGCRISFVDDAFTSSAPKVGPRALRVFALAILALTFHLVGSTVLDTDWPAVLSAHRRVALVVGNSAYHYTPTLENPKNDATDVASSLRRLGFQVIEGLDLDKAAFDGKIREFTAALHGAEVGVLFYAGHGLQVSGHNYLVPIDAQLTTAAALDVEMVGLDVIHQMLEREAQTSLLFFDACRNNPLSRNLARALGTRSPEVGRGLAPVENGVGTLISFSTQPGNVALDGEGRNSPYSGALLKQLNKSSEDVNAMLIAVRNEVMKETGHRQIPWENSALTNRFYFNPTAQVPFAVAGSQPRSSEAAEAWSATKDTMSSAVLAAFIMRYPDTFYAELAQARIEDLKK